METTMNTEQITLQRVVQAANQIAEGKTKSEVISDLEKQGIPSDAALAIATKGEEIKKTEFRKSGQTSMLIGAGLAGLGIAITAGSYSAASSGGGHYVITTGLIMVGAWTFVKGLWRTMAG
jgi:hypothetical protein